MNHFEVRKNVITKNLLVLKTVCMSHFMKVSLSCIGLKGIIICEIKSIDLKIRGPNPASGGVKLFQSKRIGRSYGHNLMCARKP